MRTGPRRDKPELESLYAYIDDNRDRIVAELQELLRQPSVSSQSVGVADCAALLARRMRELSIETELHGPETHPIVLGRVLSGAGRKTLLIYTHYDVQPADPVEAWLYPPFKAVIEGDRIIARGATDAKGNLICHLKALEAYRAISGAPPLNLTFLFDGEEEMGSPHLPEFVAARSADLRCDATLGFDGGFDPSNRPLLALGSSGLLCVELRSRTGTKDVHSGRARLVPNAAWRLIWALSTLKDPDERIRIGGFYADVRPPTDAELAVLEEAPWDDEVQRAALGVEGFLLGLTGRAAELRLLFQPTCNVMGFHGGYTGPGYKTVVPSTAAVKVDFRLVVNQDPSRVLDQLRRHLAGHGFEDVEVKELSRIEPARSPLDSPIAHAVRRAAECVYHTAPLIRPTESASGRGATWLAARLGVAGAETTVGPPDWRGHAPDEFMTIPHLINGVKYAATVWWQFAHKEA
jgi:acetylornithine deacetylase/succinyl-diaminopimelate desuccinylase-like protein